IRPPVLSDWVMMSIPAAMRSFSLLTDTITVRSSPIIRSTISTASSLSISRVAGLICSVGRDRHLDCSGMLDRILKNEAHFQKSLRYYTGGSQNQCRHVSSCRRPVDTTSEYVAVVPHHP